MVSEGGRKWGKQVRKERCLLCLARRKGRRGGRRRRLTLSLEGSEYFFQVAFAHDAQFRVLCFFGLVLLGVDVQAAVQLLACL